MIGSSTATTPSFSQIKGCSSTLCGSNTVTTVGAFVTAKYTSSQLSSGVNYNIYYACTNNVPGAQINSITFVGNTFKLGDNNTPIDNGNTSSNGSDNSTSSSGGSTFMVFSLYSIISLIFLIFV